jgi:hypothetical protein
MPASKLSSEKTKVWVLQVQQEARTGSRPWRGRPEAAFLFATHRSQRLIALRRAICIILHNEGTKEGKIL